MLLLLLLLCFDRDQFWFYENWTKFTKESVELIPTCQSMRGRVMSVAYVTYVEFLLDPYTNSYLYKSKRKQDPFLLFVLLMLVVEAVSKYTPTVRSNIVRNVVFFWSGDHLRESNPTAIELIIIFHSHTVRPRTSGTIVSFFHSGVPFRESNPTAVEFIC